jgi:hypothetical protein
MSQSLTDARLSRDVANTLPRQRSHEPFTVGLNRAGLSESRSHGALPALNPVFLGA